ncbi:MAG: hypothetical protein ACR2OZ_04720 [Verrucomicrobiales bacterium]
MDWAEFAKSPFVWGLLLGLLFFVLSAWAPFKTKRDFRRYRKHLSDKLDLDAAQLESLKKEKEGLLKESENLRLRLGMMAEKPDQKILRDLEILTRAEKRMIVRAPGFAPAWEAAKAESTEEVGQEEIGKSLPKRFFNRLFGNPALKTLEPGMSAADSFDHGPGASTNAAPPDTDLSEPKPAHSRV